MNKKRAHIKFILLLSIGIFLPTVQASRQPIKTDSKIDIPSNQLDRLPKHLRPSASKIKNAKDNDQDLYLVLKQRMLVGGGGDHKVTWYAKSSPPSSYAIRLICAIDDTSSTVSYENVTAYLNSWYDAAANLAYDVKTAVFGDNK